MRSLFFILRSLPQQNNETMQNTINANAKVA